MRRLPHLLVLLVLCGCTAAGGSTAEPPSGTGSRTTPTPTGLDQAALACAAVAGPLSFSWAPGHPADYQVNRRQLRVGAALAAGAAQYDPRWSATAGAMESLAEVYDTAQLQYDLAGRRRATASELGSLRQLSAAALALARQVRAACVGAR